MESALKYDPLEAPELEEWLAIDEAERINLRRTITDVRVFASRMKGYARCFMSL
jgi:hypothetical protein